MALVDPEYQQALGDIAASFEHLEQAMPAVLAVLMGTPDTLAAGYVYRSLRNPSIRSQLMWHLLEVAPHNRDAPEWFDEILRAHDRVRSRRNAYVHGLWSHKHEDDTTFLARFPEHGMVFPKSKREPLANLRELVVEIRALTMRVLRESNEHIATLRKRQVEQVLKDAERQAAREARRAAKATPPQ